MQYINNFLSVNWSYQPKKISNYELSFNMGLKLKKAKFISQKLIFCKPYAISTSGEKRNTYSGK